MNKRLTTKTSIMGRKHDLAYGYASIWKKKLSKHYRYDLIEEAVDKLGQLEDIESSLGIDLITLFKALKEDIYYNDCGKIIKVSVLGISPMRENKFCLECYYDFKKFRVDTRDYGKTWTLTREDLEDD